MGYSGATLTQVFTRASGADVSLRDVTIAQMGNGARECGWRRAPEARGGFWKKSVSWVLPREKTVSFRLLAEARPVALWRVPHEMGGGDGKVIIERLRISLPYVETFNSKVIKGFVPELRSRYLFSCFGIPMFYVYMLWTFYARFSYSWIRIWLWYRKLFVWWPQRWENNSQPALLTLYLRYSNLDLSIYLSIWLCSYLSICVCDEWLWRTYNIKKNNDIYNSRNRYIKIKQIHTSNKV